jgi:DNA repair protein RAD16
VGVPIKWRGGEYGWISSWQHPTCLRVPDVSRAELATQIHGLNDLSPEDRKATLDELTSEDAVQLDTIDPNDPSFSKRDDSKPAPRLDAPRHLTRPLLGFQQEGLGWMVANEAGSVNGGILADEMGMGKTIQTIALLLHQKEAREKLAVEAAKKGRATRREDARAPTLVVVPTSALAQWEDEIRDCVAPGALRVLVYYADRKRVEASTLQNADVVLTTYPVVEGEWRKCVNRAMVPCRWCGKKLLPRSLVTHLKYFCGPDAVRTAKLAKREKTRDVANEKAMRTLRIKKGDAKDVVEPMRRPEPASGAPAPKNALPTPGNFYRELMTKAGRPAMSMYDGAMRARRNPSGGGGDAEDSDSEVQIVGETTPAKSEGDAEDEAMLRVAMEVSRREAEDRDAAAAASSRPSRRRGKPPPPAAAGKKARARPTRAKPAPDGKRKKKSNADDESDDDEWLPDAVDAAGEDRDAQLAVALALGDAATRLPVKRETESLSASDDAAAGDDPDAVDLSDSLLHTVEWDRIVLDEAHKIKARTTNTAKCIYDLRSRAKWCLTGTPLQNRVGELYSLVRFLRMDPHAYYFCKVKGCECKSLCWNFGPEQRACRECGHAGPRHYSHFNQTVINPINRYGYVGDGRKGFLTLRNDILLPAQLRRTKAERAEDVRLPSLTINVAVTQMDEVERDFYESLYMLTRAKFDGYVKKGSVLHNYAHIFELLSRLRQTCDHPYLVVHSKSRATAAAGEDAERGKSAVAEKRAAGAEKGEARKNLRRGRSDESPSEAAELAFDAVAGAAEPKYYCGMCQDDVDPDDAAMTGCKHVFHRECIMQYASCAPETGEKVTCPTCRVPLTVDLQPSDLTLARRAGGGGASAAATKRDELPSKSILSRIDLSKYTSSTKVEALLRGLREMRDEDRTRETTERARAAPNKAIVFSQYTNMIEIVEWRLKKENFVIAKLLGSMPVTQRAANLRAFREDPSVTVILMSLKSGGEGLNLQTANRVFVLEPWWNPAVEMQAVMRAHRIGQTRPVIATRFCTADTIEERMFDLQKKKALVFEGCMDGNQASLAQLTEEDLQFLFKR